MNRSPSRVLMKIGIRGLLNLKRLKFQLLSNWNNDGWRKVQIFTCRGWKSKKSILMCEYTLEVRLRWIPWPKRPRSYHHVFQPIVGQAGVILPLVKFTYNFKSEQRNWLTQSLAINCYVLVTMFSMAFQIFVQIIAGHQCSCFEIMPLLLRYLAFKINSEKVVSHLLKKQKKKKETTSLLKDSILWTTRV